MHDDLGSFAPMLADLSEVPWARRAFDLWLTAERCCCTRFYGLRCWLRWLPLGLARVVDMTDCFHDS